MSAWARQLKALCAALAVLGALLAAAQLPAVREALSRRICRDDAIFFSKRYLYNFKHPDAATFASLALKNPRVITVLATCELAGGEQVRALPQDFIPDTFGTPVVALGHGGIQSIAMAGQLAASFDELRGARLVIVISPDWFRDMNRTQLSSFFEFVSPQMLARYHYNPRVPAAVKKRLRSYLHDKRQEMLRASPIVREILDGSSGDLKSRLLRLYLETDAAVHETAALCRLAAAAAFAPLPPRPAAATNPDWETLLSEADARYKRSVQDNPFGFDSRRYAEYFSKHGPWPRPAPPPVRGGDEYLDFLALVALLKAADCHPLFIIQGYNPKAYTGLEYYGPLLSDIKKTLADNGMPVLDLWNLPYRPSSYWGPQEAGDAFWLKADEAIHERYP